MKSVFSSRVSKFNALLTLCALGVTTLSLPVTAAPQEVCVKTSAGDVACGTPVPKPSSNQNRSTGSDALPVVVSNNVKWELKSCVRQANNIVHCSLSISTNQDLDFNFFWSKDTRLVDSSGNEYYSSKVQIGERVAGNGPLHIDMAQGSHYQTTIDFADVPTSISKVALLQIAPGYDRVRFRNVPIN